VPFVRFCCSCFEVMIVRFKGLTNGVPMLCKKRGLVTEHDQDERSGGNFFRGGREVDSKDEGKGRKEGNLGSDDSSYVVRTRGLKQWRGQ